MWYIEVMSTKKRPDLQPGLRCTLKGGMDYIMSSKRTPCCALGLLKLQIVMCAQNHVNKNRAVSKMSAFLQIDTSV